MTIWQFAWLLDTAKVCINVQPTTGIPQEEKGPHIRLKVLNGFFKM